MCELFFFLLVWGYDGDVGNLVSVRKMGNSLLNVPTVGSTPGNFCLPAKRPSFAQGSHKAPAAGSTKRAALKGSDKNAGAEAKPTKRASTRGGSSKPDGMNSEDFVKRSVRAVPASFTADAAAIQKKYTNTGGMGAKAEPKSYLKPRVFAAEEEQVDEWDVAEDCCKVHLYVWL